MMNIKRLATTIPITLIVFFLLVPNSKAQTTAPADNTKSDITYPHRLTFGLGAGINMNFAKGTYTDQANSYSSGFGAAPTFFALLEIPLADKWMLVPRVHYSDYSGSFTDGTPAGNAIQVKNFAYNVQTIGLDILGKYAVLDNFHILFGPSIATMIKKSFAHGTSSDASSSSTDLPGTGSVYAAIGAGIGYDIPINSKHTVWLSPELFYSFPLTNLGGSNGDLKISTLRAALSVKFDIGPDEKPAEAQPAAPQISVSAKGVLPNGDPSQDLTVGEQVTRTRTSMPMLPYIFFDYNSAEIPTRYVRNNSTGYSTDMLEGKDALEANHNGLDVLGARMRQYPDATVTLTGTNSNSGKERNNIELSRLRAMAVRDYLVKQWNIDPKRIIVDERNLPELPTNPVTKAGMEENRRVEISSSDTRMTEPIKIEKKNSQNIGETLARFETSVTADPRINIVRWDVTADENGTPLAADSGKGTPPHVLTVKIPNASNYVGQPVHYQMNIYDADGKKYSADGMTRISSKPVESAKLEKYAMLSFDFNLSDINPRAQQMIGLIGESISRDATAVNVTGFCDNTGADDYNQALSEARADAARKNLQTLTRMPANTNVIGMGKRAPKFTNDLPEGRMLNRRVEVDIQKSSK
ncbi:MAG TPA: OmpA family protein [Candidatus Kapabacteria bacterium]|nr:OmpA family protein [Candidatus Kapabacteria bacterium]